ncbi:MAG: protein kinase [Bradymonadales bacterium]|nr:protein kinase [Bradymonadales bacterium]
MEANRDAILVVAVVLLLLLLVVRKLFWKRTEKEEFGQGLDRESLRLLRAKKQSGDDLSLADALFNLERYEKAAELYDRLNYQTRAAEAYERAGKVSKAVHVLRRAGLRDRAAQVAASHGLYSIAAEEYAQLGQMDRAAECYLKTDNLKRAAELYEQLGRHRDAGKLFARLREYEPAADNFAQYFEQQYRFARGDLSAIEDGCKVGHRAATYYKELGRIKEAVDLFRRAGFSKEAAELLLEQGRLREAADVCFDTGEMRRAAELFDQMGDRKRANACRAELALKAGDQRGAAALFAAAEEPLRAAELYYQVGELAGAARLYEEGGDFISAAEILADRGETRKAAELYAKGGQSEESARLYELVGEFQLAVAGWEESGNYLKAGVLLFQNGKKEEALQVLARMGEFGQHASQARWLEGSILFQLGRVEEAKIKFQEALGGESPDHHNLDIVYNLGRCAELSGEFAEAIKLYDSILSVNNSHQNAKSRADVLRKQMSGAQGKLSALSSAKRNGRGQGQAAASGNLGIAANRLLKARYEIIEEIARGGMGIVYRARDTVLNRMVAYKILGENLKHNRTAVEYFLREARAAAAMTHPNIVMVFDAGEQDDEYYMAMEYVEGETLKSVIRRSGPLDDAMLRFIITNACRGLAYAHDKGLVHRDIKSGNLMITKDNALKIMDFGLAKFVEEASEDHTRAIGTPYYMSPEQILGKNLDGRSDIYSLGITLFECATGKVPFAKGDLSYHHLHTAPPRAKKLNPQVADDIDEVIHRAIQKKPEDRFQHVGEIAQLVQET